MSVDAYFHTQPSTGTCTCTCNDVSWFVITHTTKYSKTRL